MDRPTPPWRGEVILFLLVTLLLAGCQSGTSDAQGPLSSPMPTPSLAIVVQPSPSALPPPMPSPLPGFPPPGWTTYLGINDVRGVAFAPAPSGSTGGTLWAATSGGVARWDLSTDTYLQYTTADGLAANYVTGVALAPASTGDSIWVATLGGVSHLQDATWTSYTEADGLIDDAVQSIAVTPDGEVWAGALEGISRFAGGVWTNYLPGVRAYKVAVAPDGAVWFANHGAGVSRYSPANDAWTTYTEADGLPMRGITALAVGPDGDVWVYENWEGVYCFDGEHWKKVHDHTALVCALAVAPTPPGGTGGTPWIGTCGSMHSAFGNLIQGQGDGWREIEGWHELGMPAIQTIAFGPASQGGTGVAMAVGTEKGLAVQQGGEWRTLRGGPTRNRVTTVAVTPDGAAWFGFGDDQFSAAGGGASRFDGKSWQYFLGDASVHVLAVAPDGALWAGTGCSVQRYDGVAWQEVAACGDLGLGNVLDFAFAPNGNVWVASGMSLARFDGRAWQDMGRMVHSIAVAPDGALWAAGWEGAQDSYYVARFDGVEWTKVLDSSLGALQVTRDGVVWGAAGERGLARFDGQSWDYIAEADGLPVFAPWAVAPDGALWASVRGGLARFDGQAWKVYPAGEGVQALAFAPDGTVWLGTSNGAVHLQPTDE